MSKRNFILLIIILVIIVAAVLGYLFFRPGTTTPGEDNGGTNFISQFNPFAPPKPPAPTTTTNPPIDISGDGTEQPPEAPLKLQKISSMPIAGFIVYQKERLKEIPVVVPAVTPITPYDFGTTTLKNGSTGDAVKEIQRFLNDTLKMSFELDGILDEKIVTAIKQWQGEHKLMADGVVGPKTKAIMYSSVGQTAVTIKPTPPPTEFAPTLRYVDRATGNIYQTFADKIEERKFSVTVIPKIYEAFFGKNGESVVMRYLKGGGQTIETFAGNLPKEILGADTTENNEVKGSFLPEDVADVSVSADASSIFYLFNVGDNIVGTTMNLTTGKKVQVFDSPFTEWLSFWPNNKMITLTTKPASSVPGYMYGVDLNTKSLTKVLGGVNGLTTLASPDGKLILYADNNLSLNVFHVDTKVPDLLGVKTLPDKCVWGKASDAVYCAVPKVLGGGGYPDAWYQGEVSFSDQIWKVDINSGNATIVADPIAISGGEDIDGIKLALDGAENYLFFVNKKDSFLWELGLK